MVRSFVRYQQWNCRHPRRRFVQLQRPVHTQHTHTHAHTHQECRWWASIRSSRSPFQDLPCSQPSHSHTDTYAHTHTYSLSLPPPSFSIIAHDARTINESSTVNKKGENKTLCGALLTVVEVVVEVVVGEEEERRRRRSSRGRQKNSLGIDIGLSPERYLYSFYSLSFFRATCCCCCDHRSSMGDSTGNHFVELPNNAGPAGSVADQQLSDTVRPIEAPCCCC